jgi:hypothetical protein
MMKKLLVLLLLMGVGGAASAGLIVTVDSASSTISIGCDTPVPGYEYFVETLSDTIQLDGAGVSFGFHWDFDNIVTTDSPTLWRGGASQFLGAPQGPGIMVSGLRYTGAGWIRVTDGVNTGFEPVEVFVPEPVSIMLLGLGGLFLRRRK